MTGTETPGTREDRFTATVANDRICGRFLDGPKPVAITRDGMEIKDFTDNEIPGSSVKFTQHGSKPQAVLVTFVAEWPSPTFDDLPGIAGTNLAGQANIYLSIDGKFVDPISSGGPEGGAGVIVLGGKAFQPPPESGAPQESNGTHGFTFVTEPIAAGNHVASILFLGVRLGGGGSVICVQARSTVVEHD
jgi:hypothetical protein